MSTVNPLGWEAITEDDEAIAAALEDVSVPALMMSMVHMTGDPSILRGQLRPAGIYLNEVQGFMSPEDQAAVRALGVQVIGAYRDGGCELPDPPSPEVVHEMMNVLVAQEVPDEYVPMLLEELELDGDDAREPGWVERLEAERPHRVPRGGDRCRDVRAAGRHHGWPRPASPSP